MLVGEKMDLRVKRAVQYSAILDIIIASVAAIAIVLLTQALQATGYLFLLPFALVGCAIPIIIALLDWQIVKSRAGAGRIIFIFNYLIISRLLMMAAFVFGYYRSYISNPNGSSSISWLYVVGFAIVLVTGFIGVTSIFNAINKSRSGWYGAFIAISLMMTTVLAYLIFVINVSPESPLLGKGSRNDKQIEYDIHLLRQDVWSFYINEKKLPEDLKQAISRPQSYGASIPPERFKTYEYKRAADGRQYDICATFANDTSAKISPNSPERSHKSGFYCVRFSNK